MNNGIYGFGSSLVASNPYGPYGVSSSSSTSTQVRVLVVGGGGGGGAGGAGRPGPGAGAGGFIENITSISIGTLYAVTIGAGGPANNNIGSFSRFGDMSALGGSGAQGSSNYTYGASAGGVVSNTPRLTSIINVQGNSGGIGVPALTASGGGGGAGSQGGDAVVSVSSGSGGLGKQSTITGNFYAGGGGGGAYLSATPNAAAGTGGVGGGGDGASSGSGSSGAVNSGGGGGGGLSTGTNGGSGGSGVVILRWNSSLMRINISAGLTYTTSLLGLDTIVTFTAGTGTVSWS